MRSLQTTLQTMTHFSKNSVLFAQTKILIFITKKSCSLFSARNLTCQEILKNIKAGETQDEDEILKEILKGNDDINVIPKLRKLIVKIRASPQRKNDSIDKVIYIVEILSISYWMLRRDGIRPI